MNSMEMFKMMMSKVEQKRASETKESAEDYGDGCRHLRKDEDEDEGTAFCCDCGLVFEDEVVYLSEYNNTDYYHPTDEHNTEDHTLTPVKDESESTESTSTSTPAPTSVKDLRRIAKERGIKYSTTMSGKDLCMVLGLEISKPIKFLFKNKETGEEYGFHAIYRASKEMGINPGLVTYYLGMEITIGEVIYTVSEV